MARTSGDLVPSAPTLLHMSKFKRDAGGNAAIDSMYSTAQNRNTLHPSCSRDASGSHRRDGLRRHSSLLHSARIGSTRDERLRREDGRVRLRGRGLSRRELSLLLFLQACVRRQPL
jgi:hypothetical protein